MNTTVTTVTVNDPALQEACAAIGRDTIIRLAQELTSARRKYSSFAFHHAEAVDVVESEFLEWKAQAMRANAPHGLNTDRRDKAEGEAFHLITTALRYVRREYTPVHLVFHVPGPSLGIAFRMEGFAGNGQPFRLTLASHCKSPRFRMLAIFTPPFDLGEHKWSKKANDAKMEHDFSCSIFA